MKNYLLYLDLIQITLTSLNKFLFILIFLLILDSKAHCYYFVYFKLHAKDFSIQIFNNFF